MSAPFRHSNRKYRVKEKEKENDKVKDKVKDKDNDKARSLSPTASVRPQAHHAHAHPMVSSSEEGNDNSNENNLRDEDIKEERYLSDFDDQDDDDYDESFEGGERDRESDRKGRKGKGKKGKGKKGKALFVVGESIADQLHLSSEFESDVEGQSDLDREAEKSRERGEVREEEGLQVSPPSRPAAKLKTVTGSAMEHEDSDEIGEYYESDFSYSPGLRNRGDTPAESDIYDESFEHEQQGSRSSSNPEHHGILETMRVDSDGAMNPLSEFSSVTFVESVGDEDSSKKSKSTKPKTHVHFKSSSAAVNITKRSVNAPLPPTNRPNSTTSKNPAKSAVSAPRSTSQPIPGKKPSRTSVNGNGSIVSGGVSNASTQLPIMKQQKVAISGGNSIVTGASNGTYLTVQHQNPIVSTVGQRNSLPATELQRQLTLTLRRLDEYKQQNIQLRSQLDGSTIYGIIEQLKHDIVDKDQRITDLINENNGLKFVSRHQGKQLVDVEIAKQHEPELVDIQGKYMEVMNEQLKNTRLKLNASRENEKRWQGKYERSETLIGKLRNKLSKWKGKSRDLERQLRELAPGDESSAVNGESQSSSIVVQESSISENNFAKVEKSLLIQIKNLQRDLHHSNQENKEWVAIRKKMEEELNKRELFGRHQTTLMRSLRHDYEALLETNRQLLQAAALYNRDTSVAKRHAPTKRPISPVVQIPKLEEPVAIEESSVAKAKTALIAEDDGFDDGEDQTNSIDTTTFLTRVGDV